MKKIFALLVAAALLLGLTACGGNAGKTNNVRVIGGKSTKFSAAEIEAAEDCVLKKFKDFEGCDLEKLWYNVIILLSDFRVDSTGGGGFTPNSTCPDWNWILIRDEKSDAWRVDDWGY